MIPILFIIPKFSAITLIILFSITTLLFGFLFLLLRKGAVSVNQLKKDLTGYYIFIIIILALLYFFGPFPIKTYGVAVAVGFFTAILVGRRLCIRENINPVVMFDIFIYIFIGVIIGSRVFYIIFYDWNNFLHNPLTLFAFWEGGLMFYGGLIGGTIGGVYYIKKKRLNLLKIIDIIGVILPLGIFFGRLGCLGYGCCFGKIAPASFPYKIKFPAFGRNLTTYTPAFEEHIQKGLVTVHDKFSLPVYPSQIIDSLTGLLLFILLWFMYKKKKFNGQIAALFLIFYAVTRFLSEFLRVEPSFIGLTVSQWIGIFIFILGLLLFRYAKKYRYL